MADNYHHGELRSAIMARAVEIIETDGVQNLSLRSIANDVGVSHTAPRHHFGDLRGVITAIATEGFTLLGAHLKPISDAGGSFLDLGVGYVDFALAHPAHFAVMFAPRLLDEDDDDLLTARGATFERLRGGVEGLAERGQVEDTAAGVIASWGMVHGIATLALTGNLDKSGLRGLIADGNILSITARAAGLLYGPPREIGEEQ